MLCMPCSKITRDFLEAEMASSVLKLFTEKAVKVIKTAQEEARRLGHNSIGTEQLLLGVIGEENGIAKNVLKSMGVHMKNTRAEVEKIVGKGSESVDMKIPFKSRATRALGISLEEARQLGHDCIRPEHLLLGLLREGEAVRVLENLGAEPGNIRTQVSIKMVDEKEHAPQYSRYGLFNIESRISDSKMRTLNKYGTDLTKLAVEGKLDPVVGRDVQIERIIQILGRRTKNNPCIIGEPGVGKTAIAEGLAHRIVHGDVPEALEGKRVITLDLAALLAGTMYRGQFEDRLKSLMKEIKQSDGEIILFIDEVHTLISAGDCEGGLDAANMLKPALARGELQCIGATTTYEYEKYIKKDPALERRFQPVMVPEPTVDQTVHILKGLRERYETHHKTRYTDESLVAAAHLSSQYIRERFLPDKAIDLIDEAGSKASHTKARLPNEERKPEKELEKELRKLIKTEDDKKEKKEKKNKKKKNEVRSAEDFEKDGELLKAHVYALIDKDEDDVESVDEKKAETTKEAVGDGGLKVTEVDIQHIVSLWTGIPVDRLSTTVLPKMEETVNKTVSGQRC